MDSGHGPNLIQGNEPETKALADKILTVKSVSRAHCLANRRQFCLAPHGKVKDREWIIRAKQQAVERFRMMPKLKEHAESIGEG